MNEEILKELEIHNRKLISLFEKQNDGLSSLSEKIEELINKQYEVNFPEEIKAEITNQKEIVLPQTQDVKITNQQEFPSEIEISNFPKQKDFPSEISVSNLPKPQSDKGLREHLTKLFTGIWEATKEHTARVFVSNRTPKEAIPVVLVDAEHKQKYTAILSGGSGGGGTTTSSVTVTSLTDTVSSLDHGSNLDIDTTAEQITSTSFTTKRGVAIKADLDNSGTIYIGNSDVTAGTIAATDGMPLSAGESIEIEIDNPNKLYAIASTNNQKVYWMAL